MLSKEQRDKTRKMHGIILRKDTVVIALLNTCDELEKERDNERKGYASLRARFDFISQKAEQRRDQVIGEMAENAVRAEVMERLWVILSAWSGCKCDSMLELLCDRCKVIRDAQDPAIGQRVKEIGELVKWASEASEAIGSGVDVDDREMAYRLKESLVPFTSIRTSLEPCLECGLPTSSPPHLVNGRCPANPDEVEV